MEGKWMLLSGCFLALLGVVTLAAAVFYCRRTLGRMEGLLKHYMETGKAHFEEMKETRESKLESRLKKILSNAAFHQEQAQNDREKVAKLLSDLSHQLKTPLSNIVMYAEILEAGDLTRQEELSFLKETRSQAGKMQWLMKNLLKASKLEQGTLSFEGKDTPVKETIARAVSAVYALASRKEVEIQVEEFPDRILFHNRKWTVEALENILENAVKYSPPGSVVTISLNPLELYTRIDIKDQGVGIAQEEIPQIFKRFYRSKQVDQEEGSGLGLYLTQLIIRQEKGYLSVSSKEGEGSCFQIFLLNQSPNRGESSYGDL